MKIYLCDDELKMREELLLWVNKFLPEAETEVFSSGEKLLDQLEKQECDLLLLDIDMPGPNGMEVASRLAALPQKPLLVFVTGHDELVYESFQYHPFGFVRKQFLDTELERMLSDCAAELEQKKRHFNFRMEGKEVCLLLSDLLYFESEGNYLRVYTNTEEYRFRSTIAAVEASLGKEGFLRVHKGFLVNQLAIRLFGTETVELADGRTLPVGKTYAESTKQQFMRYLRA